MVKMNVAYDVVNLKIILDQISITYIAKMRCEQIRVEASRGVNQN